MGDNGDSIQSQQSCSAVFGVIKLSIGMPQRLSGQQIAQTTQPAFLKAAF
jgi:hypothetical protein